MEEQKNYTTIRAQAVRSERDAIEAIRRYILLLDRRFITPYEAINLIKEIAK